MSTSQESQHVTVLPCDAGNEESHNAQMAVYGECSWCGASKPDDAPLGRVSEATGNVYDANMNRIETHYFGGGTCCVKDCNGDPEWEGVLKGSRNTEMRLLCDKDRWRALAKDRVRL